MYAHIKSPPKLALTEKGKDFINYFDFEFIQSNGVPQSKRQLLHIFVHLHHVVHFKCGLEAFAWEAIDQEIFRDLEPYSSVPFPGDCAAYWPVSLHTYPRWKRSLPEFERHELCRTCRSCTTASISRQWHYWFLGGFPPQNKNNEQDTSALSTWYIILGYRAAGVINTAIN